MFSWAGHTFNVQRPFSIGQTFALNIVEGEDNILQILWKLSRNFVDSSDGDWPRIAQNVHPGWVRRLLDVGRGEVVHGHALGVVGRVAGPSHLQRPVHEGPHGAHPGLGGRVDEAAVYPGSYLVFLRNKVYIIFMTLNLAYNWLTGTCSRGRLGLWPVAVSYWAR